MTSCICLPDGSWNRNNAQVNAQTFTQRDLRITRSNPLECSREEQGREQAERAGKEPQPPYVRTSASASAPLPAPPVEAILYSPEVFTSANFPCL